MAQRIQRRGRYTGMGKNDGAGEAGEVFDGMIPVGRAIKDWEMEQEAR